MSDDKRTKVKITMNRSYLKTFCEILLNFKGFAEYLYCGLGLSCFNVFLSEMNDFLILFVDDLPAGLLNF